MSRHDEALKVLLILRRRLLDRMATAIVERRESLLNGRSKTNSPLSSDQDLAEMTRSLSEIDHAISGLADVAENDSDSLDPFGDGIPVDSASVGLFARYLELVRGGRLEEASRELSKVFHMSLDRVTTATRFFARNLKADPRSAMNLAELSSAAQDESDSQAMRAMIKTFGFQAVESRMALEVLRSRLNETPV